MKTFNWTDYAFVGLLILATVMAGVGYYEAYTLGERGRVAKARVKSVDHSKNFSSTALFTANLTGSEAEYYHSLWFEDLVPGQQVEILYITDAQNQPTFHLKNFWSRYRQPTIFLVFVAIFLPLMIVKGLRGLRDSQLNVTEAQPGN